MTQRVRVVATKFDDQGLMSRTHTMEIINSNKVFSDLHVISPPMHMYKHTYKEQIKCTSKLG